MRTNQILTMAGHNPDILASSSMVNLPSTESTSKCNDTHDGVSTGVTDPMLTVEVFEVDVGVVFACLDLGRGSSPV